MTPSAAATETTGRTRLRLAVVSGDGLPVSGLLTELRNVLDLAGTLADVCLPVPTELGYGWRPDKPGFFPDGAEAPPDGMPLEVAELDLGSRRPDELAEELLAIRRLVATWDRLDAASRVDLAARIDALAPLYDHHFDAWLRRHDPDWVLAINMTLSDAVPATAALHRSAARHFADRPGGVVFWDHDLFGSCAIHDHTTGARLYPSEPNPLTPVPQADAHTRWFVVSDALAEEAARYPTDAVPLVVPNVLPRVPSGVEDRHQAFAAAQGLDARRPLLLNPVRVFRVKGVELAIRLLAAMRAAADHDREVPYLLVFGSLAEEPDYARELVQLASQLGVAEDVRFLDGVPLRSTLSEGTWRLDELDLLRLAADRAGAVVFTPSQPDVETVGLAAGLAAVAGLPCALTDYTALERCYGRDLHHVRVDRQDPAEPAPANQLLGEMRATRRRDPSVTRALEENERLARTRFPTAPWAHAITLMLD